MTRDLQMSYGATLAGSSGKQLEKKGSQKNRITDREGGMTFTMRGMVDSHKRKEIAKGKKQK